MGRVLVAGCAALALAFAAGGATAQQVIKIGVVGPLTGAFGHSGFTGTSLVVDPARRLTVVLLTNAVHPVRGRDGIRELRHAVAAEALRLHDLAL